MKVLLNRFLGFGAVPLIAFIAPFFLIPFVSDVAGVEGWAAIGTAQAIGTFCVMVGSYGWNVSGGAQIALSTDQGARQDIWSDSFWSRLIASVLVGTAGALLAAALVPDDTKAVAAMIVYATTAAALTTSWYGVGIGSARTVLLFDTIPVAVSVAIAIPLLILTQNLFWYPIMTLVGALSGPVLLNMRFFRRPFPPLRVSRVRDVLRSNLSVAAADGLGGGYTTAPVPLAQVLVGTQAGAYTTSADKIYRISLVAITVLANTMQKWVLELSYAEGRLRRHLVALGLHLGLALVGCGLLTFLGPIVSRLYIGADKTPSMALFAWYGVVFGIVCLTTPLTRNVLIPARRNGTVLLAIGTAVVVGVPLMILGSSIGPEGIAMGLAASELVVLIIVGTTSVLVFRAEHRRAALTETHPEGIR